MLIYVQQSGVAMPQGLPASIATLLANTNAIQPMQSKLTPNSDSNGDNHKKPQQQQPQPQPPQQQNYQQLQETSLAKERGPTKNRDDRTISHACDRGSSKQIVPNKIKDNVELFGKDSNKTELFNNKNEITINATSQQINNGLSNNHKTNQFDQSQSSKVIPYQSMLQTINDNTDIYNNSGEKQNNNNSNEDNPINGIQTHSRANIASGTCAESIKEDSITTVARTIPNSPINHTKSSTPMTSQTLSASPMKQQHFFSRGKHLHMKQQLMMSASEANNKQSGIKRKVALTSNKLIKGNNKRQHFTNPNQQMIDNQPVNLISTTSASAPATAYRYMNNSNIVLNDKNDNNSNNNISQTYPANDAISRQPNMLFGASSISSCPPSSTSSILHAIKQLNNLCTSNQYQQQHYNINNISNIGKQNSNQQDAAAIKHMRRHFSTSLEPAGLPFVPPSSGPTNDIYSFGDHNLIDHQQVNLANINSHASISNSYQQQQQQYMPMPYNDLVTSNSSFPSAINNTHAHPSNNMMDINLLACQQSTPHADGINQNMNFVHHHQHSLLARLNSNQQQHHNNIVVSPSSSSSLCNRSPRISPTVMMQQQPARSSKSSGSLHGKMSPRLYGNTPLTNAPISKIASESNKTSEYTTINSRGTTNIVRPSSTESTCTNASSLVSVCDHNSDKQRQPLKTDDSDHHQASHNNNNDQSSPSSGDEDDNESIDDL